MAEAKPFASLSSGLLARKGAARPAMRPQGFGQAGASLDDLGWNDMGFDPPRPAVPNSSGNGGLVAEHPVRPANIGLTPVQSPVHDQQAEIVDRLAPSSEDESEEFDETAELYDAEAEPVSAAPSEQSAAALRVPEPAVVAVAAVAPVAPVAPAASPAVRRAAKPRSAPGAKGKAAFTLRLDPDRHLKLRLACAVSGRSAQQLVTDALDTLLASMPELDAMAEKAKRKG